MRIKSIVTLAALLIVPAVFLSACSAPHLVSQAEKHEQAAGIAVDTATKIQGILDKYPAGSIEDGQLAQILGGVLPAEWQGRFNTLIAVGNDVRESAEILAGQLPGWAEDEIARAQTLRIKAAAEESKINNLGTSVTNFAQSVGGVVGIVGAIAGVWFRRKQAQAVAVTKDIVTSMKSSPSIQAAIDAEGGNDLRKSYSPETMQIVKAILDSH